jgi:YD repeat-containing protein
MATARSQNAALTYNAGGQVQSDLLTVATAGTQTLTTYAYNAAGRIQSVRQSTPSNSAFFSEHAYTYSSANTLSAIIATGNSANDIYRWDYTVNSDGLNTEWRIDLDSNQTVEAIVYIDWESGPCLQTFIWAPRAHPNFVAGGNVPYAPGSGLRCCPLADRKAPYRVGYRQGHLRCSDGAPASGAVRTLGARQSSGVEA